MRQSQCQGETHGVPRGPAVHQGARVGARRGLEPCPRRHHRLCAGCARPSGSPARQDSHLVPAGITHFAQDALGDVVYVDVPQVAASVTANQPFSEVESTKSVSDVYAPVSGTVVERNQLLEERPELVNEQPYGDGWLVVLEVADAAPLDELMDATAYRAVGEQQADGAG